MSMKNDSGIADNTTTKIASLWENQKKIIELPPLSSLNLAQQETPQHVVIPAGVKGSWELDQSMIIESPLKYVWHVEVMEIYPHETLSDLQK